MGSNPSSPALLTQLVGHRERSKVEDGMDQLLSHAEMATSRSARFPGVGVAGCSPVPRLFRYPGRSVSHGGWPGGLAGGH